MFSIVVAPPPARQATATLTEYDPGSPDGGADAFRRDESLSVTVTSTDQDVDAGSVRLRVYGVSTNPVTGLEVPLAPCAPGSPAASNPFCKVGTVSLAPLPFEAFRAVVPLEVSGSDLSSNLGKADAGVNVTRWKWRYSAGAPIYTTPALADDGTIVFGTSDGGSGSVYALNANGSERWRPVELGPVQSSPIVGPGTAESAFVYTATASPTTSKMHALRVSDGADAGVCASGTGAPFLAGLALVETISDNG
ncbi:MAG TPA: PQQ-binding-like beta-propeller repeat protein, partial [Myxococcaceae bacterium]|nr:PQQ-binding-like beta-propeller repeat protein [Myxococcaceae bacterium]